LSVLRALRLLGFLAGRASDFGAGAEESCGTGSRLLASYVTRE
jgi:hypothetical protein